MSEPAVIYEVKDRVATLTLNRPENRNSMTPDVLEALGAAVAQARTASEVRCVIVTGTGKSFCAGADFKAGPIGGAVDPDAPYLAPHDRL